MPTFEDAVAANVGSRGITSRRRRTRMGVVVPSVNTVAEPWLAEVLPADVAVHASRMLLSRDLTPESLQRMDREEGIAAAVRLASCRPAAIAYCCTASSAVQGPAYDELLRKELEHATGTPCFTAIGAIVDALNTLGVRRICIASPYTDVIDEAEVRFFEAAGFEVCGTAHLGIGDAFELASPSSRDVYEVSRKAWRPGADALVISCLNMHSHEVVDLLECQIDRPVITSTTATLWKLLRVAGRDDHIAGLGRLLSPPNTNHLQRSIT